MSANTDLASVLDIVTAAQQIQRYSAALTRAQLEQDDEKQAAILYRIAVIGEAVKRISPAFRAQHPQVPWRKIAGMRDIVLHQYDRVNLDLVWSVIETQLPQLLDTLTPLLPSQ